MMESKKLGMKVWFVLRRGMGADSGVIVDYRSASASEATARHTAESADRRDISLAYHHPIVGACFATVQGVYYDNGF